MEMLVSLRGGKMWIIMLISVSIQRTTIGICVPLLMVKKRRNISLCLKIFVGVFIIIYVLNVIRIV